jgi:hypothetical protein
MNLEDELQIPPTANMPASSGYSIKTLNGSSIDLSRTTSLRKASSPRCLIVGRQAATSDIRIQHGSISRKHAAFYFIDNHVLILKEFGGKHGTHVNGNPIRGEVVVKGGDTLMFGNVRESIFTVQAPIKELQKPITFTDTKVEENSEQHHNGTQQDPRQDHNLPVTFTDTNVEENSEQDPRQDHKLPVAVTRDAREAQIAAMVASFDAKPTYQKYTPAMTQEQTSKTIEQLSVAQQHKLPITQEFHIDAPSDANTKHPLTSLVVDRSGSRFVVGNGPYLKLYDFSGMDRQRTVPFKTLIVEEGYTVEHVCYSNSGDRIMVGTASPQPSIFDRDGELM